MSSSNGQLTASNSKQKQGGYNAFFNIHFDQFSTKPLSTPVLPTTGNYFELPSESAKEKKNNSNSGGECPLASWCELNNRFMRRCSFVFNCRHATSFSVFVRTWMSCKGTSVSHSSSTVGFDLLGRLGGSHSLSSAYIKFPLISISLSCDILFCLTIFSPI